MNPFFKETIRTIIEKYNQSGPIWKQEGSFHSAYSHLMKRKKRKEIPIDWSLEDYDKLIVNIMNDMDNNVHLYYLNHFSQDYFVFDDGQWMVIVGQYSVMETCMYRKDTRTYLRKETGYTYLGKVKEVFE